jgi:hypothetical protein
MRILLMTVSLLMVTASIDRAEAQTYPWCAQYGYFSNGGRNCGFSTYAQCMATVSGIGGFCERNPFYAPRYPGTKRKRSKR